MIKDYNQILPGLEQDIIKKINILEKRRLFLRQSVFGGVMSLSFIGMLFFTLQVVNAVSNSGTYEYVSLLIEDISLVSYWKEITLSLLDSLPLFSITLSMAVLGMFLWSLLNTLKIQSFKTQYDIRY